MSRLPTAVVIDKGALCDSISKLAVEHIPGLITLLKEREPGCVTKFDDSWDFELSSLAPPTLVALNDYVQVCAMEKVGGARPMPPPPPANGGLASKAAEAGGETVPTSRMSLKRSRSRGSSVPRGAAPTLKRAPSDASQSSIGMPPPPPALNPSLTSLWSAFSPLDMDGMPSPQGSGLLPSFSSILDGIDSTLFGDLPSSGSGA
ncbi:MAG: hypothetical protein P4L40_01485 [Terracidiphilus sp.]|nr:hypothetical protein [Terracidiphilus sp.]